MQVKKVNQIQQRIKETQDRQKSYADNRRRDLEFEIGDFVLLRVSPFQNVIRFGKKGKLSPRYIGPFQIQDKVGPVAYQLILPMELKKLHDVFHVSQLRKYIADPSHVIQLEPVQIQEDLSNEEQLVQILDNKEKFLRNKTVNLLKILWRSHAIEEATWETEEDMRQNYPQLFGA